MRLKNFLLLVVGVIVTLSLSGCTTVLTDGKKFDMSMASGIKKGVTTKNDILAMFGEPNSKSQHEGEESWRYFYSESRADALIAYKATWGGGGKVNTASQSLSITFKGDIVQDYSTDESKM